MAGQNKEKHQSVVKILVLLTFLSIFFCPACKRNADAIFLWECEDSHLYLNTRDTCWMVKDRRNPYDVYVTLKHDECFNSKSVDFKVTIGEECDTVKLQLTDDKNRWIGKPYIGSYVTRFKIRENVSFLNVDSILFSITPVASNALMGIEWLAIELDSK